MYWDLILLMLLCQIRLIPVLLKEEEFCDFNTNAYDILYRFIFLYDLISYQIR